MFKEYITMTSNILSILIYSKAERDEKQALKSKAETEIPAVLLRSLTLDKLLKFSELKFLYL